MSEVRKGMCKKMCISISKSENGGSAGKGLWSTNWAVREGGLDLIRVPGLPPASSEAALRNES